MLGHRAGVCRTCHEWFLRSGPDPSGATKVARWSGVCHEVWRWRFTCLDCEAEKKAGRLARSAAARRATRAQARAGRRCLACRKPFTAQRRTRKFCSSRCKLRAWRNATRKKPLK